MALLPGTHAGEANFGLAGLAVGERRPLSVPGLQSKGQSGSLSPKDQDSPRDSRVTLAPVGWHAPCSLLALLEGAMPAEAAVVAGFVIWSPRDAAQCCSPANTW